jgi:hypothetical protein
MPGVGPKHELSSQPERVGVAMLEFREPLRMMVVIVLKTKTGKLSGLPCEHGREAMPVVPEGIGISLNS